LVKKGIAQVAISPKFSTWNFSHIDAGIFKIRRDARKWIGFSHLILKSLHFLAKEFLATNSS